MDKTTRAYEALTEQFTVWARTEEGIRAAFVIGSRARENHPADEWADLDVAVIVRDVAPYISEEEWVRSIGTPWITFVETTLNGQSKERRVLFEGGLDVDFSFFPAAMCEVLLAGEYVPPEVEDIISRGIRILVDKDGLAERLRARGRTEQHPRPPTQAEYQAAVNDFWYHAVWTAKHLRRGELWWAKSGCDSRMKELLQTMLEWHAIATGRGDTWFRGRFLEEWADPRALREMRDVFAHYDPQDVTRALFATMDLFRWLGLETAQRLGYSYSSKADESATALVRQILPESGVR